MARKYPLSDVGCDSDALNVNVDDVGQIPRHQSPAQRMRVKWYTIYIMMSWSGVRSFLRRSQLSTGA